MTGLKTQSSGLTCNRLEGQNGVAWTECLPDAVTCQLECPIHREEDRVVKHTGLMILPVI